MRILISSNLALFFFVSLRLTQRYSWHRCALERCLDPWFIGLLVTTSVQTLILRKRPHWDVRLAVATATISLFVLQHICMGGLQYTPQIMIHGRSDVAWWCPLNHSLNDVDFYVNTLAKDSDRYRDFSIATEHLHLNITPVEDDDSIPSDLPPCWKSFWGMTRLLRDAYEHSNKSWIAVFEDDAIPHFDFNRMLRCALDRSEDANMILCDARSDEAARFVNVWLNSALVVWRRIQLPYVVLEMERFIADERTDLPPAYDQLWNVMCRENKLKCRARPLVSESGASSTLMSHDGLCLNGVFPHWACGELPPQWC